MNYDIKLAAEEDFSGILALIQEFATFQKTPGKVTISLQQMRGGQHLFNAFIAIADDRIIGFASFFPAWYSWSGKALYLDDLYVQDAYRNMGIGKALLDAVINKARAENCIKLSWQVSNWNTNAIEFYKKIGAEIDEVEINCDLRL
jgi:GNAT superfamily N-acetyltransferase